MTGLCLGFGGYQWPFTYFADFTSLALLFFFFSVDMSRSVCFVVRSMFSTA